MVKETKAKGATLAAILLPAVMIATLLMLPGLKQRGQQGYATFMPLPAALVAAEFSPWEQAVQKLKEDRGEPTGKQAAVDIPPQLRHYSDTRRFLAIQVAEWQEHRFETPHDFADLAALIMKGEMVELKPVGENYVLYGVGGSADKEPFTYYEKKSGKRITLYGEAELAEEYARSAESRTNLEHELANLRQELDSADNRERSRRVMLQAQIAQKEKALGAERETKELLDVYYGDAEKQRLLTDHQTLERLSRDFSGHTYDVGDARSRKAMKVRMLSFLRPEALKVLEDIARSYQQKFDRPLPVTSLVRPDEYQHQLSKVNPNATLIETPPHSTGLAFDIYYRFMTAEEQSHVMADLARLEDEGRIEVLRENRDHFHVFAFIDGGRPDETLIREYLGTTTAVKAPKETQPSERISRKDQNKSRRKGVEKKEARRDTAQGEKKDKKVKGRRR